MMKMTRLIVLFCLAIAACASFAQGPPPVPQQIKDMNWLVGKWTSKVKFTFPGAEAMEIDTSWTVEEEGPFLKHTSTMDFGGMKMTETSYQSWDDKNSRFNMYTFSSMAPTPRIEHAPVESGKAVFTSEPWDVPGMPPGMVSRTTITKLGDKEMKYVLEFKNGDAWDKVGEGTYKKA